MSCTPDWPSCGGCRGSRIPPTPLAPEVARQRVADLRSGLPHGYGVGISGDPAAAVALTNGCDGWYSMIGAVLPDHALRIVRAAQAGDVAAALQASADLDPVWQLYRRFGSLRTVAALAVEIGDVAHPVLPRPLRPVPAEFGDEVRQVLVDLGVL